MKRYEEKVELGKNVNCLFEKKYTENKRKKKCNEQKWILGNFTIEIKMAKMGNQEERSGLFVKNIWMGEIEGKKEELVKNEREKGWKHWKIKGKKEGNSEKKAKRRK